MIEVGASTRLTASGNKENVTWSTEPAQQSIVTLTRQKNGGCVGEGIGFGQVKIIATDAAQEVQGTLTLFVGSVIIAGADGMYWQVQYDPKKGCPVISKFDAPLRGSTLDILIKSNAVVADLTDADPKMLPDPIALVTCYVLNLNSFTDK
ncbi:hypothetical protein ACLESO_05635 [Pyxidicoccus sp. 3LG]